MDTIDAARAAPFRETPPTIAGDKNPARAVVVMDAAVTRVAALLTNCLDTL
jgi:hypothetical protein